MQLLNKETFVRKEMNLESLPLNEVSNLRKTKCIHKFLYVDPNFYICMYVNEKL